MSAETEKSKWKNLGRNSVLTADNFYISYNSNTEQSYSGVFTALGNMLGGDLEDGEETALVITGGPRKIFKILTGDWRNEYEKRFPDLDACVAFFGSKKSVHGNNWSTLEEDCP